MGVALYLVTSNLASRNRLFGAGGLTFIQDLLPYLKKAFGKVTLIAAGREKEEFKFKGIKIIIQKSILPGFYPGKGFLPAEISEEITGGSALFLDALPLLTVTPPEKSGVVVHHTNISHLQENATSFLKSYGILGLFAVLGEKLMAKSLLSRVKHVFAVSPVTVKILKSIGIKPIIAGNGINPKRFRKRKKESYAVAIGRLVPYKRFDLAIKAATMAGIELKIIGEGPLLPRLRATAPENVEVLGYLEEKEKVKTLERARYLLSFSEHEGFGFTLLEAMAAYAVPVVSDIAAHRFVLKGGKAGFLVKTLEEAAKIIKTLEVDEELWKEKAATGRKLVEEVWNAEKIAQVYIQYLK